jgi:hypothetical protein
MGIPVQMESLSSSEFFFPDPSSINQFIQKCDENLFFTLLLTYLSKYVFTYFSAGIQMGACRGEIKPRKRMLYYGGRYGARLLHANGVEMLREG